MDYVRRIYGVPAKRGGRVTYTGSADGKPRRGTITSADHRLLVRLDGDKHPSAFHPTWELTYGDAPAPAPEATPTTKESAGA
jgi:hypothetical protein